MTSTATDIRTYSIDTAHSEAAFEVRHLITRVRGRFTEFEGAIRFDQDDPERSSVEVAIKAASIDTSQHDRDAHLRSADFFDAEHFPTLTFKSTRVRQTAAHAYHVAGDLTIRGVTRPVVLETTFLGVAKDPWGRERAGFEAELTVDRKDFGLTWNAALEAGGFLVGDKVRISLAIQAVAQ